MDRKKELKHQYKEAKTKAGIYQIRNLHNEKTLVVSTPNLQTMNGKKFMLKTGAHPNKLLQKDWNELGEDAFAFEVLEELKVKEDVYFDAKYELEKLEEKWLDKLQPYDECGYHRKNT